MKEVLYKITGIPTGKELMVGDIFEFNDGPRKGAFDICQAIGLDFEEQTPYHLYLLSDEEIIPSDWMTNGFKVYRAPDIDGFIGFKKIIGSTDKDLGLPGFNEHFLKTWVKCPTIWVNVMCEQIRQGKMIPEIAQDSRTFSAIFMCSVPNSAIENKAKLEEIAKEVLPTINFKDASLDDMYARGFPKEPKFGVACNACRWVSKVGPDFCNHLDYIESGRCPSNCLWEKEITGLESEQETLEEYQKILDTYIVIGVGNKPFVGQKGIALILDYYRKRIIKQMDL
jgi:hypothetical protein